MGELLRTCEMTLRIEDDEERVCARKNAAGVRGHAGLHVELVETRPARCMPTKTNELMNKPVLACLQLETT